jgi:hypothetical protein
MPPLSAGATRAAPPSATAARAAPQRRSHQGRPSLRYCRQGCPSPASATAARAAPPLPHRRSAPEPQALEGSTRPASSFRLHGGKCRRRRLTDPASSPSREPSPIGRRTKLGRPRSPLSFMPLWVAVLVSCYRRHDGKQPRVPEWIFKLVSVITRITTMWIVQTTDEES